MWLNCIFRKHQWNLQQSYPTVVGSKGIIEISKCINCGKIASKVKLDPPIFKNGDIVKSKIYDKKGIIVRITDLKWADWGVYTYGVKFDIQNNMETFTDYELELCD